jgi:NAD(P)-dependent dehydrogenase (short-subunit alcohol dehydrogenase family)
MLAVTGYRSKIVSELRQLLPKDEEVVPIERASYAPPLIGCERYLLCAGLLRPRPLLDQTPAQSAESLHVNCIRPIQLCDHIFENNARARICVVGSESGFTWSHDGAYAGAKAALHRYVETKRLKPEQQLVCVAPSIIEDCSMTLCREDTENLEKRRRESPKQRFLRAEEVARTIHFLLYTDQGYITGQVIRMNGGV